MMEKYSNQILVVLACWLKKVDQPTKNDGIVCKPNIGSFGSSGKDKINWTFWMPLWFIMILEVDQILVKDQIESNFSNLLVAVKAMPAHAAHEIEVDLLQQFLLKISIYLCFLLDPCKPIVKR